MTDATPLPFDLPAVRRKKLTLDFDGGNQSSDAGVLLLRAAEAKIGVIAALAAALPDRRDPTRVRHKLTEIIASRVFALCCGYEDGIDHNQLRYDPALKMAVGRCPESGADLASQSTISRFENAPTKRDALRLSGALVDYLASQVTPAYRDIFDIDDTFNAAYGGQQGTFWNGHNDERGFASMHVYHARTGLPVATILRPAKTPGGEEVRTVIKHITKRLLKTWKRANIVWRHAGGVRGTTRWSLLPRASDGMVRRQRCRLHLRPARRCIAYSKSIGNIGTTALHACAIERAEDAHLHIVRASEQHVVATAQGDRTHRILAAARADDRAPRCDASGDRCALCRDFTRR